jgi:toxin ParE1/3/4
MKVVLTERALADLDEIADWIGRDNWDRAEAFIDLLQSKCMTLSRYPRRYPLVTGAAEAGLRKLTFRDYLIFYRPLDEKLEILRIVHRARDWAALLAHDK